MATDTTQLSRLFGTIACDADVRTSHHHQGFTPSPLKRHLARSYAAHSFLLGLNPNPRLCRVIRVPDTY